MAAATAAASSADDVDIFFVLSSSSPPSTEESEAGSSSGASSDTRTDSATAGSVLSNFMLYLRKNRAVMFRRSSSKVVFTFETGKERIKFPMKCEFFVKCYLLLKTSM